MALFTSSLINDYGLLGIFIGMLLSYSIIPLPPEPFLTIGAIYFNPVVVLVISVLGSTIGSILNYYIGLKGIRAFFIKSSKKGKKAEALFNKYGPLSIVLFSWLPIIGDPLIIVAGTLRMKFWKFMIYSTIGKLWYFIVIIWFSSIFASLL